MSTEHVRINITLIFIHLDTTEVDIVSEHRYYLSMCRQ